MKNGIEGLTRDILPFPAGVNQEKSQLGFISAFG